MVHIQGEFMEVTKILAYVHCEKKGIMLTK